MTHGYGSPGRCSRSPWAGSYWYASRQQGGKPGTAARQVRPGEGSPLAIALRYLRAPRPLGLTGGDLQGAVVTDRYRDAYNGVTHVYLQQRYRASTSQRH